MLSMLLILACTNAGAGGKTSTEVRLRIIAESLTALNHNGEFSTEARIDETTGAITVFIPESTDAMSVTLSVYLLPGITLEYDGTPYMSSDQDTPIPLTVNLLNSVEFIVEQAGIPETYIASALEGIPIFTEGDLKGIQNIQDDMQENYFLMNDIALESNFEPLGSMSIPYTGIFDGREKTISDLKIIQPSVDSVGFFKYIGYGSDHSNYNANTNGEVRNLVLALAEDNENSPSIEGKNYVGAVAGQIYGKIDNVAVTGGIVKGVNSVGGLVGQQNAGNIETSHATGDVTGNNSVGGLVGYQNAGNIINTRATGDVTGKTDSNGRQGEAVGGLVGYKQGIGNIETSYATGDVTGNIYVGGLVGNKQGIGDITDSHATGAVTGTETDAARGTNVGGLVGYQNGGDITDSHATGAVNGPNTLGGLVGWLQNGKIKNSYATGDVEGTASLGGLLGWQTAGTIENSHATGAVMGDSDIGGLLGFQRTGTIENSYATGAVMGDSGIGGLLGFQRTGTIENSYATGTVSGTSNVGGLVGDKQGTGNIENSHATGDVTGKTDGDGSQAKAVGGLVGNKQGTGNIENSHATGDVTGKTDGDGSQAVGGLVGWQQRGSITNSHATGDVEGTIHIGGLVGYQQGDSITNSHATGDVEGTTHIGGLVGYQQRDSITASYATGAVTGGSSIGGLVGQQEVGGSITNSYARGTVLSGNRAIGGLLGDQRGSITNSYATGAVSGTATAYHIGGLVGVQDKDTGTITSSYFDAVLAKPYGQTTESDGVGSEPNTPGVTPFYTVDSVVRKDNNETADAVTRDDFVGWSFDGTDPIWHLPENGHWPILYWQNQ